MKQCRTCGKEIKGTADRHLDCFKCRDPKGYHNEYIKVWQKKNYPRIKARRKEIMSERYSIANKIKEDCGCTDCGIKDYRVLEFDHTEDNKEIEISRALSTRLHMDTILKEIEKCEVVCANCHRIRTIERRTK
jgi:hypothetical protein